MASQRLYRSAVAGAGGPVGEALTKQLLHSRLCSEVLAFSPRTAFLREIKDLAIASKVKDMGQLQEDGGNIPMANIGDAAGTGGLHGVDTAYCVIGDGRWATAPPVQQAEIFAAACSRAAVPHVTVLCPQFGDASSRISAMREHAQVAEVFKRREFRRLSLFMPSLVIDPQNGTAIADQAAAAEGATVGMQERAFGALFPLVRQFMPSKYREVCIDDLVLAMRLNAELCGTTERVERLDFVDMMSVIGKDGDC